MTTTNRFTAEGEAQTIADRITKDIRAAVDRVGDRRRVRVGRRERRDVLREPRRPERADQAARVPHAAAGTNVYLFHEDATPPDTGGSPGNYTYTGAASTRIDGQYLDTSQPMFSYFDADGDSDPDADHDDRRACAASTSSASTSASA